MYSALPSVGRRGRYLAMPNGAGVDDLHDWKHDPRPMRSKLEDYLDEVVKKLKEGKIEEEAAAYDPDEPADGATRELALGRVIKYEVKIRTIHNNRDLVLRILQKLGVGAGGEYDTPVDHRGIIEPTEHYTECQITTREWLKRLWRATWTRALTVALDKIKEARATGDDATLQEARRSTDQDLEGRQDDRAEARHAIGYVHGQEAGRVRSGLARSSTGR